MRDQREATPAKQSVDYRRLFLAATGGCMALASVIFYQASVIEAQREAMAVLLIWLASLIGVKAIPV